MEQPIDKNSFPIVPDLAVGFVHKRSGNEITQTNLHENNKVRCLTWELREGCSQRICMAPFIFVQ